MTAWTAAQAKEINHAATAEVSRINYVPLLHYFGVTPEYFADKSILEIGGGNYPICGNLPAFRHAVNIEPLWDQYHDKSDRTEVENVPLPFEDYEPTETFDEVWFFNILQHTIDPHALLEKAKRCARLIRVFEPIDCPVDAMHLHVLTWDMFSRAFPTAELKRYKGGTIHRFHGADCCYFEAQT